MTSLTTTIRALAAHGARPMRRAAFLLLALACGALIGLTACATAAPAVQGATDWCGHDWREHARENCP